MSIKNLIGRIGNIFKMAGTPPREPVIFILGGTGTGKTKLSLEISSTFNGEIINADAMQIYKGLNITTNKATESEQSLIKHHLLGHLEVHEQWTVIDFQKVALNKIKEIHERQKIPVVIGGTFYYIESLLWDVLIGPNKNYFNIDSKKEKTEIEIALEKEAEIVLQKIYSKETTKEELYKLLQTVDEEISNWYHINDTKRVIRALEIYATTGIKMSDHVKNQRISSGGKEIGGRKRFENALIFCLHSEKEILLKRLEDRVDTMIENGLVQELDDFYQKHCKDFKSNDPDCFTKGIFQCIGLKQFQKYLLLSDDERKTKKGENIFNEARQQMICKTNQYSKRQNMWIKNRILIRDRQAYSLYRIDTSDPSRWNETVTPKVYSIVNCFLNNRVIPYSPEELRENDEDFESIRKANKVQHFCEDCDSQIIGDDSYKRHLSGSKHSKVLRKKRKLEEKLDCLSNELTKDKSPKKMDTKEDSKNTICHESLDDNYILAKTKNVH